MPMIMSLVSRLGILIAISLLISGCGRTESYRYKLTLAVSTPDGVRRASTVVRVTFRDVSFPARGTIHKLDGQALYLDLGPGKRPLIALLTNRLHRKYDDEIRWTGEAGPGTRLILQAYGQPFSREFMDDVPRVARLRGPRKISPNDLPDLVTFADIGDPNSVIEVDRNDLQASLGATIIWNEVAIESTGEPITRGLERDLPWIATYFQNNLRLDRSSLTGEQTVANRLSWWDFVQSSELKRNN
ncbi:hypothetical protein [Bradyrhizobium sp. CCBAU 53415]|uniref:hypothetical protein n=1 Tax=Bradyrhizobium sp. CCBAU 53415 TaxID=1325119 RepID=UPI0023054BCB|nr:hypothetical protein [Bradyrhizobium sp. CCBAU 53415]MDA9467509.1 hypothetical protein [Bradyrhizobium sp. CCBAU 53415]